MTDKRPDPKPRKHPLLWQSYLLWEGMNDQKKRHKLRLSSIENGKSMMDPEFEGLAIADIAAIEQRAKKWMVLHGRNVGLVWDWMNSIRGIGFHTSAKILALFDDVGKFSTISKFWRFSGWGVFDYWIDDNGKIKAPKAGYKTRKAKAGEWTRDGVICDPGFGVSIKEGEVVREYIIVEPKKGWKLEPRKDIRLEGWNAPYNNTLKKECYLVGDNFIKQQTPLYVDVYYEQKARLRELHPVPVEAPNKPWKYDYTDSHIHRMARRKMVKLFLSHLWLVWRECENLPISKPWINDIGGHIHFIPPPNWPLEDNTGV